MYNIPILHNNGLGGGVRENVCMLLCVHGLPLQVVGQRKLQYGNLPEYKINNGRVQGVLVTRVCATVGK